MKRICWKDKVRRFLIGLSFLIMVTSCAIKKQTSNRIEIHKDSTHSFVDTSYYSKEVSFEIESEEDSKFSNLIITQDEFDSYIDSLFADIDIACDKERIIETIIKTNGLWNTDTSYLETTLARSYAVVEGGNLYHFLHQKDTTITRQYDSLLLVIEKEREIWHSKEVHESSEKITRSGFNFKIIVIIIIVLLLAWVILKRFI